MSGNKKETVIKLAMPRECIDFIKRNPNLMDKLSQMLAQLKQLEAAISLINNLFTTPEVFESEIQDGTREELIKLLEALINNSDKMQVGKMSENEIKDFMDVVGEYGCYSRIKE